MRAANSGGHRALEVLVKRGEELLRGEPGRLRAERTGLLGVLSAVDLAKFARLAPEPGEVPGMATRALATLDRLEDLRRAPAGEADGEPEALREAAS